MNFRNLASLKLAALASLMIICTFFSATNAQSRSPLSLKVSTDKDSYVAGEMVSVTFAVSNISSDVVTINSLSVDSGNLKVFITDDAKTFRQYLGPRWGLATSLMQSPIELKPGAQYQTTATVLFNHRIETEDLSDLYAKQINSERISSDFAFPRAGHYSLKAMLNDPMTKSSLESNLVDVAIYEPAASDSIVWQRLNANSEYAFFLHTGRFRVSSEASKPLVDELNSLMQSYPDTIYSSKIIASLKLQ